MFISQCHNPKSADWIKKSSVTIENFAMKYAFSFMKIVISPDNLFLFWYVEFYYTTLLLKKTVLLQNIHTIITTIIMYDIYIYILSLNMGQS